jgi:hypothetical protein
LDPASDFHRICAATLIAFFVAQSRDFVPLWFIPFLPAAFVFGNVALRSRRWVVADSPHGPVPGSWTAESRR